MKTISKLASTLLILLLLCLVQMSLGQESEYVAGPMITPGGSAWYQAYTCCYSNGGDVYSITLYDTSTGATTTYAQGTTNYVEQNATVWNGNLAFALQQCAQGGCYGDMSGFTVIGQDNKFSTSARVGWVSTPWVTGIYNRWGYIKCNPNCPP